MGNIKLSYPIIQKIAVFYVAIWSISPPLMIGTVWRLLALGCVGIWFVLAIARGFMLKPIHCWALLFVLAVAAIAYIQYGSVNGILKLIAIYMLVIGFLMAHFYKGRWEELKGLVPILLILYLIWNFNTIQALLKDPTIARQIVRDDIDIYAYLQQGIGGYELIYPQVCVWPAVAMWIVQALKKRSWVRGIIGILWAASFVWLLFLAGYSIAICASLFGLIMLLFYNKKNVTGALVIALTLFIGGALILLYVPTVRETLLQIFSGTAVEQKINDLVATDVTGETVGSIHSRVIRYTSTLNGLINYPVVGSLWVHASGGHSAILDNFVKYGVWGGAIYALMLFYIPNQYKKNLDNSVMRRAANAVLVSLIFVSLLDTVSYSFAFMVTIVLSLLYENIAEWDKVDRAPKKPKKNIKELYFRQKMEQERMASHHKHYDRDHRK